MKILEDNKKFRKLKDKVIIGIRFKNTKIKIKYLNSYSY